MFAVLLSEGMNPFYQNIASFPTVFFTFFLALTALYWLVAVLGFVDLDVLDFDIPDVDGDINADSGLSNPDVLAGLMLRLGLHGVPVTIIVSLMSLVGWLTSYYIVHFFFGILPDGIIRFLVGLPVLVGVLYLSALTTGWLIKPLRPLFLAAQQETVKHVLGQVAIVRTSRIDSDFGEVDFNDGGAGLILKARSAKGETFTKGDRVVLFEHIKESGLYRVISEDEFLGK